MNTMHLSIGGSSGKTDSSAYRTVKEANPGIETPNSFNPGIQSQDSC